MEAASDLVVEAAARHAFERLLGHGKRSRVSGTSVDAQQQRDREARRELLAVADSSPGVVEERLVAREGRTQRRGLRLDRAVHRAPLDPLAHRGGQRVRCQVEPRPVVDPQVGKLPKYVAERGPAAAGRWREVGPPVERVALGREPDVERPATPPGQLLHRRHVHPVDVGSNLAVDLDRDEVLVQEPRGRHVVEGLLLHHVAPMAGRVADADEHRAAEPLRGFERLVAPRIPVDRIVGVLLQVGTRLEEQAVAVGRRAVRPAVARARHVVGAAFEQQLAQARAQVVAEVGRPRKRGRYQSFPGLPGERSGEGSRKRERRSGGPETAQATSIRSACVPWPGRCRTPAGRARFGSRLARPWPARGTGRRS